MTLVVALLCGGAGTALQRASAGLLPANDSCADATLITSLPYADAIVTTGATSEPSDPVPDCGSGDPRKSVWYRFTAPRAGTIDADTFDSDYDTILSAYTGTCAELEPVPAGCSDDDPFDGAQSRVRVPASGATTYYFMVSAFARDGGNLMWHLRFIAAPNTPTPPVAATATAPPPPTETPGPAGDANCDRRTTAADLPALIELIATERRAPCLLDDADGDGSVSAEDLPALIEAIFATD